VTDVYGPKRAEIQANIEEAIRERFEKGGLLLLAFDIRNVNFTDEYAKSIEQKQIAQQQAEQMSFVLDKEKKEAFSLSMYRFFDAPQVIFVCLDASLGAYAVFDCGGFVQTICLLATAKGLGTCIQHSGVNYPDIIRKYVPIPEEKEILVAIAIGYPDEEAMVNRFRSNREPLENVVHWMDLA
jgi:nitroreductase